MVACHITPNNGRDESNKKIDGKEKVGTNGSPGRSECKICALRGRYTIC